MYKYSCSSRILLCEEIMNICKLTKESKANTFKMHILKTSQETYL